MAVRAGKFHVGDFVEIVDVLEHDAFYNDRNKFIGKVFRINRSLIHYQEDDSYGAFLELMDGDGEQFNNTLSCQIHYRSDTNEFALAYVRLMAAYQQPELPPDFKPNSLMRR